MDHGLWVYRTASRHLRRSTMIDDRGRAVRSGETVDLRAARVTGEVTGAVVVGEGHA
jgi:hypothetical protein